MNPLISLVGEITGLDGVVEVDADTAGVTGAEDAVIGEGGMAPVGE